MAQMALGPSVKAAVKFMQRIHRDADAMLKALEDDMRSRGWTPTQKNRISDDLSNAFDASGWMIASIFRIYTPEQKAQMTTKAAAIHVLFDPPDLFEEPMVLAAMLRFPKATAFSDFWNNWLIEGSEEVLKALATKKGPMELSAKLLKSDFFPDASTGAAFAVPLCGLESEQDVRDKIASPIFALLK